MTTIAGREAKIEQLDCLGSECHGLWYIVWRNVNGYVFYVRKDGRWYNGTGSKEDGYWPSREDAQADLDKFADKPTPASHAEADVIGNFPISQPNCFGCGKTLLIENAWMADGCPCNHVLGVNNQNETRWRLLMLLQQRQHSETERLRREVAEAAELNNEMKRLLDEACDQRDEALAECGRRNHGASGLCCQLRLLEKGRAEAAEAELTALREQLAAAERELTALKLDHANHFADVRRILEWAAGDRSALFSFTDGPERQMAYLVEAERRRVREEWSAVPKGGA